MKYLHGAYNLKTGVLTLENHGDVTAETAGLKICVLGRVKTEGGLNRPEEIAAKYQAYSIQLTQHLAGQYILLLCDTAKKSLYIFHDRMTSPFALYYLMDGEELCFSTSLKKLIRKLPAPRAFEPGTQEEFLQNGFIYSEKTLVKGISKIKVFHALYAHEGKIEQIPVEYAMKEYTAEEAMEAFKPVLDRSIEDCFTGKQLNMPLSSGYDSNYILHIANQAGKRPIHAFSIGGSHGTNELPQVRENVQHYKGVKLHEGTTTENTLKALPDIVWRLEGSVFQFGVFLQYELARLAAASGIDTIICGECADQVFNKNFLEEERINTYGLVRFTFREYPYAMGSQLILKKSGIMLNSFGMDSLYPYLDDELISVAHALRNKNGVNKLYHKENCQKYLPPEIIANISKIGGTTDCHSLFENPKDIKQLISTAEGTKLYKEYGTKVRSTPTVKEIVRNRVGNMLKKLKGQKITNRVSDPYAREENRLKLCLNVLYLRLFEELFLSGSYDDKMNEDGFSLPMDEMLSRCKK